MKNILLLVSAIITSSCSMQVTKIQEPDVNNTRVFNADYESVWLAAVDWFADNDVVIDKIEKESGLITAKHKLKTNFGLVCDKVEINGLSDNGMTMYVSLNATIRDKKEKGTKVRVNITGRFEAFARDDFNNRNHIAKGDCYSNGEIEKQLFNYIESEAMSKNL